MIFAKNSDFTAQPIQIKEGGISGAMFRFNRSTIARNCAGSNVLMDLVNASQGPQYIPETKVSKTMLKSSNIFIAMGCFVRC